MPRKKRPLTRDSGVVRDASLMVIACEDTHAVKQYFARFSLRRVQIHVLPTEDGRSSPKAVMARLDRFKAEEATEPSDEFWVCLDTDHWIESNHIGNLRDVLRQCRQKGYQVALNRPCFELWLLLHFQEYSLPDIPDTCAQLVAQVRNAAGSYQKNRVDLLPITSGNIRQAIQRAEGLDTQPDELLPGQAMTRIYRILNRLQERDSIDRTPGRE